MEEENAFDQQAVQPEETPEQPEMQQEVETEAAEPAEASQDLFADHFRNLEQQGQALKESFPQFDLGLELQNPVFLQLTAPGTGINVEDAYYAIHRREIEKAQASETTRKIVSAIQSGSRRPLEAGTSGQGPSLTTFQYGSATREQREAFKKELRRAWGRGETVYPR